MSRLKKTEQFLIEKLHQDVWPAELSRIYAVVGKKNHRHIYSQLGLVTDKNHSISAEKSTKNMQYIAESQGQTQVFERLKI